MKRFFKVLSMALVAVMAISCYDDSKVWEKLDSLESQLAELTSQVNSVSTIVSALEKNVYVKAVTEVTGGYEIEFTDGKKVTVKDGKDGADAPEIGAVMDVDGVYYWTLDGEWLLDAAGNKVPAGMGQPKLKTEDGQWYISADGKDWALIGPDVACTIEKVVVADETVTFTVAGQELVLPIFRELDVTFNVPEESIYDKESATVEYTVVGGTEKTRVTAMCTTAAVSVKATDANTGVITVNGLQGEDYEVVVFVTDGVSRTIFKTLKFVAGTFTTESDVVTVTAIEGALAIPVATNIEYVASVQEGCDWITLPAETKAEIRNEEVIFNVAANPSLMDRTAEVYLTPKDELFASLKLTVTVVQKGTAVVVWEKNFADYSVAFGNPIHVAYKDGNLLVSTGSAIHLLNPATGEYVADGSAAIPAGFVVSSMATDDAGNLVIAGNIANGASGDIYALSALDAAPVKVATMQNNVYSFNAGNLRAGGDVTNNGVVAMFVDVSQYYIACDIIDGVCGETVAGALTYEGAATAWSCDNGCVVPLGTSVADGFLGTWYTCPGLVSCTSDGCTAVGPAVYTGNDNNCAIAEAEYKDVHYAAVGVGSHFNYSATGAYLYNLSTNEVIYKYGVTGELNGLGATADVTLVPAEDALYMFYADLNMGRIACVQLPL